MKLRELMPNTISDIYEYDVTPLEELMFDYYADKGVWVDVNGNEHKINEMSTEYIINCLKLINRKKLNDIYMSHIVAFTEELKERGVDFEVIEI